VLNAERWIGVPGAFLMSYDLDGVCIIRLLMWTMFIINVQACPSRKFANPSDVLPMSKML